MDQNPLTRRHFIQGTMGALGAAAAANTALPADALRSATSPGLPDGQASALSSAWFMRSDPVWMDKLSKPQYDILFEFNIKRIKMRDGVLLSANIWRPKAEGRFPVIYLHLPYDKSNPTFCQTRAKFFVPRGYVVVAIDARGKYDSDGVHYIYWSENWREGQFHGQDVYDSIGWIAQQPWASGRVGMTGPSYVGYLQWLGAYLRPPNLTTIVPYVSPDDVHDNAIRDGAYLLARQENTICVNGSSRAGADLRKTYYEYEWLDPSGALTRHLPLRTLDEAILGRKEAFWQDYLDHPDNDEYWDMSLGKVPTPGEIADRHYSDVNVPTLSITGWYDALQSGSINNYIGMRRFGPERLRDQHHLVVGPWTHQVGVRKAGDIDFGPAAVAEQLPPELQFTEFFLRPIELRWFDHWLKGIDNGIMDEAPVHLFRMGDNNWRAEREWPLTRARDTNYYLRCTGKANSLYGDGTLSTEPSGMESPDVFVYDPEDPVITVGGTIPPAPSNVLKAAGAQDQRIVQSRNDVLVYSGDVLTQDLEVTGKIFCKLYAATSALDTDFTAKLNDVHPDGYAQLLREGVIRARYRQGYDKQVLIKPGEVYEYTIFLWSLCNLFKKGHRIQVEISSSNFPLIDRNPNTGHKIGEDKLLQKATQTIYHDRRYPSHIILPIVSS